MLKLPDFHNETAEKVLRFSKFNFFGEKVEIFAQREKAVKNKRKQAKNKAR